jgi:hypothetical protein
MIDNLITLNQIHEITGLARGTISRRLKTLNIKTVLYSDGFKRAQKAITVQEYKKILAIGRKQYTMSGKRKNDSTGDKKGIPPTKNREHQLYMRVSPYWELNSFQGAS